MTQHETKPSGQEEPSAVELDEHDIEKVAGGLLTSDSTSTSHSKSAGKVECTWKTEEGAS